MTTKHIVVLWSLTLGLAACGTGDLDRGDAKDLLEEQAVQAASSVTWGDGQTARECLMQRGYIGNTSLRLPGAGDEPLTGAGQAAFSRISYNFGYSERPLSVEFHDLPTLEIESVERLADGSGAVEDKVKLIAFNATWDLENTGIDPSALDCLPAAPSVVGVAIARAFDDGWRITHFFPPRADGVSGYMTASAEEKAVRNVLGISD